jgi:hypothetical protein
LAFFFGLSKQPISLSIFSDRCFSVFLFVTLMLLSDTLLLLQRFYVLP